MYTEARHPTVDARFPWLKSSQRQLCMIYLKGFWVLVPFMQLWETMIATTSSSPKCSITSQSSDNFIEHKMLLIH